MLIKWDIPLILTTEVKSNQINTRKMIIVPNSHFLEGMLIYKLHVSICPEMTQNLSFLRVKKMLLKTEIVLVK